ncbi:MAG: 4-hydroxy-tetrahydrodipicolinate synthase [Planctomycetes bacterium]|nr:4-hydroxy-tetrahydrodipicolinate synthase [Planctomycetota bacterium]
MFEGTYTALVTPFKNGEVDTPAFEALIERQISGKVDGLVPAGCTGEAATLTPEEQLELIKLCVEIVAGRVPVVAGTGSNSTREAVLLTSKASKMNIQGALVITPYYNKPTPSGLLSHYFEIAEKSRVPLIVYNVPGRTGTKITPQTLCELARHPNIRAVKEACGCVDQVSEILATLDDSLRNSFEVLSGDDALTLPMISVGAKGVISVASNVAPAEVSALVRCALDGDFASATQAHLKLHPLFKGLFVETNPIPVKTMLAELGLISKELRLPMEYGKDKTVQKMRELIHAFNLRS